MLVFLLLTTSAAVTLFDGPKIVFNTPGLSSKCFDSTRPNGWSGITAQTGTSELQNLIWRFSTHCWEKEGQGLSITFDGFPEGLESVNEDMPPMYHYWPSANSDPRDNVVKIPLDVSAMRPGEYSFQVLVGGLFAASDVTAFPVKIKISDSKHPLPSRPNRYTLRILESFGGALQGPNDSHIDQSYHYNLIDSSIFTIANGNWGSPLNWVQQQMDGSHLKKFTEYSPVRIFTLGLDDFDNFERTMNLMLTSFDTSQAQRQMVVNSQVVIDEDSPSWFAIRQSVTAQLGSALSIQVYAAISDDLISKVPKDSWTPDWTSSSEWIPKINAECDEFVSNKLVSFCALMYQGDLQKEDEVAQKFIDKLSRNFKLISAGGEPRQQHWEHDGRHVVQPLPRGVEAADITLITDDNYPDLLSIEVDFTPLPEVSGSEVGPKLEELIDILKTAKIQPEVVGGEIDEPGLARGQDIVEGTVCDFLADGMMLMMERLTDFAVVPHTYCQADVTRPTLFESNKLTQFEVESVLPDDSAICEVSMTGQQVIRFLEKQWRMNEMLATSKALTYYYDSSQSSPLMTSTIKYNTETLHPTKTYRVALPEKMLDIWDLTKLNCHGTTLRDAFIEASFDEFKTPLQRQIDVNEIMRSIRVEFDSTVAGGKVYINIHAVEDIPYTELAVYRKDDLQLIGYIGQLSAYQWRTFSTKGDMAVVVMSNNWEQKEAVIEFKARSSSEGATTWVRGGVVLVVVFLVMEW